MVQFPMGEWEPASTGSQQSKQAEKLDGFPLALLVGAVSLKHLEPTLALARIFALAVILRALAIALALASIDAEAAAFHRLGSGGTDQGGTGDEQRCGRHGNLSTGFPIELHFGFLLS
jgi:hypothetical protein